MGRASQGLCAHQHPPATLGTEVGQVTGCAGGHTAQPQPPTQHCQWVQRSEPEPAPTGAEAPGAMQPTRARAVSSRHWEAVTAPAEAVAVLRMGLSCCLDLSYKTTSTRDHFKQLCCSPNQSHQCARAPALVATSTMGAHSGQLLLSKDQTVSGSFALLKTTNV